MKTVKPCSICQSIAICSPCSRGNIDMKRTYKGCVAVSTHRCLRFDAETLEPSAKNTIQLSSSYHWFQQITICRMQITHLAHNQHTQAHPQRKHQVTKHSQMQQINCTRSWSMKNPTNGGSTVSLARPSTYLRSCK